MASVRAFAQPIRDGPRASTGAARRTRSGEGFGGVAEYGITVRWDKNFLKLIRLLLERGAARSA